MKLVLKVLEGQKRAYLNPAQARGHVLNSEQVAEFMRQVVKRERREVFCAFMLDNRNRIYRAEVISVGTINASIVHPREVYAPAIQHRATALIACHNHPSGFTDPSEDDIEITKRLMKVGDLVGIELLDHVIVGKDSHVSMRERGLIRR